MGKNKTNERIMSKIEKKHIVTAALIGLITITGAILYIQYKRIMNYVIKFYSLKINTVSMNLVNFDLFLNFINNANVQIDILEQDYKVYINDALVTTATNHIQTTLLANATSILPINIQFNPSSVLKLLGNSASDIVLHPEKINLKADIKLKVKLYGFKVSIPYVYQGTLKDINDARKANKAAKTTQ